MKIKIYIVTYNQKDLLEENLCSLYDSDLLEHNYEINILNNHSNFTTNVDRSNLKVLHNSLRPDFSTGHLAKDWNAAIVNGFQNLNNPDCDIVVCCQDDAKFKSNWASYIIEQHQKYSFIAIGQGDAYHSYTPSAIKKIGLWDERFCGIGYQEKDYFLRSKLFNNEKSSFTHINNENEVVGCHNCIENKILHIAPNGSQRAEDYYQESMKFHAYNRKLFETKWKFSTTKIKLALYEKSYNELKNIRPVLKSYFMYPYFEKDIDGGTKEQQRYLKKV